MSRASFLISPLWFLMADRGKWMLLGRPESSISMFEVSIPVCSNSFMYFWKNFLWFCSSPMVARKSLILWLVRLALGYSMRA